MSVETLLCDGMGYEHCVLFSRARIAIAYFIEHMYGRNHPLFIPSNCCPTLQNCVRDAILLPVSAETGLSKPTADITVQLYGYRQEKACDLEIDPLMTGWGLKTLAESAIISFGYSKTIDMGEGAALVTHNKALADDLAKHSDWIGSTYFEGQLKWLSKNINYRKERLALWDEYLDGIFKKPTIKQTIPWRVIRLVEGNRDKIINGLRTSGYKIGTNYPPLPGCTDPSSVKWGREVINFFLDDEPGKALQKCA